MLEYETRAIVLAKKTVGETDGRIALYTEELGKVDAIAKGLKKIIAKLSHHLEPLNLIQCSIVSANNKHLTSALTINSFLNIRKNEAALFVALKNVEILNQAFSMPEPDKILWKKLNGFLENLDSLSLRGDVNAIKALGIYFLFCLADILGVMPEIIEELPNFRDLKAEDVHIFKELMQKRNGFASLDLAVFSKMDYNRIEQEIKKLIIYNI
ncbi:MAG TPA: DNA repair protein RecO [Candidatus Paceibacterota bacterium]|nr:DNA repair protein RecO [Candidatus Paceibacterota bacterium]